MQDFASVCFSYKIKLHYGSPAVFMDDWDWVTKSGIHSFDHLCDVAQRLDYGLPDFSKLHNIISSNRLPLIYILLSHLAAICVRSVYVVMTLIAFLLFSELDQRAEKLVERSIDLNINSIRQSFPNKLNKWMIDYTMVNRFTENVNSCFGLILLIFTSIDFLVCILDFQNIFFDHENPVYYFRFCFNILRYFLIVAWSDRVILKV